MSRHNADPFTAAALARCPPSSGAAPASALAAATGVGPDIGRLLAIALVAGLAVLAVRRRPIPRRAVACFLAIVAEYAIVGLVRSQLEDVDATNYTRYTYFSGMIAMLGLVSLVGRRRDRRQRLR